MLTYRLRLAHVVSLAAVGLGVLTMVAPPSAAATTFTAVFPSGSSNVVDSGINPTGSFAYFWSSDRGDKVEQTFADTGLNAITELDLNFDVTQNGLSPHSVVDWDVRVNGTTVGSWQRTAPEGVGPVNLIYTFAPIVGDGTFDVGMFVTDHVPSGAGAIGVSNEGSLTLKGIGGAPEPSSLAILVTGGLPLFGLLRRRR
jgi:hypothetical protein